MKGALVAVWAFGLAAEGQSGVVRGGCPAAVPPAVGNGSAAAADFVEMKRSGCSAGCASYTVRIGGDGRVAWEGVSGVEVKGRAAGTIETDAARALMQRLADRGFWGLCTSYRAEAPGRLAFRSKRGSPVASVPVATTPLPVPATITTTLSIGGQVKSVEDSAGAAPAWLRELDLDIDRVGETHGWRHGGPGVETFGADRAAVDEAMPKTGVTQLMRASSVEGEGQMADVLRLLSDVNARDSSGWTALMYAAQAGSVRGMQVLLDAGADVFARSNAGETALLAAVSSAYAPDAKVRLLAARGLDMNTRDNRGVSALMLACRYGGVRRRETIVALLALGADASKRDADGRLAADYLAAPEVGSGERAGYEAVRGLLSVR